MTHALAVEDGHVRKAAFRAQAAPPPQLSGAYATATTAAAVPSSQTATATAGELRTVPVVGGLLASAAAASRRDGLLGIQTGSA